MRRGRAGSAKRGSDRFRPAFSRDITALRLTPCSCQLSAFSCQIGLKADG